MEFTSTNRSARVGNSNTAAVATPPPKECPTTVTGEINGVSEASDPPGVSDEGSVLGGEAGDAAESGKRRGVHAKPGVDQLLEGTRVRLASETPPVQEQHRRAAAAARVPSCPAVDPDRPPPHPTGSQVRDASAVHTFHRSAAKTQRRGPPDLESVA